MLSFFWFLSLSFCIMSFLNLDPLKSSLFLIFSLLSVSPLVSFSSHVWFSYFICLLFLSGVFVILVYFSSLSKINYVKSNGIFLSLLTTIFLLGMSFLFVEGGLGLTSFYFSLFSIFIIFLILVLLGFMNFSSYFLNFSGALRKM